MLLKARKGRKDIWLDSYITVDGDIFFDLFVAGPTPHSY